MTRNTKRNNWTTIVGLLLACTLAVPAQAEFITFTFGGTITEVDDDNDFLDGAVSLGDSLSGSYTFESTTPDRRAGDPTIGSYWESVVTMDGLVAALPYQQQTGLSGNIAVADNLLSPPRDGYDVYTSVECSNITWSFFMGLDDPSGQALDSDALWLEPSPLDPFPTCGFEFYNETEDVGIRGVITYLLPEPGSFLVLLLGTGVLLPTRCRH